MKAERTIDGAIPIAVQDTPVDASRRRLLKSAGATGFVLAVGQSGLVVARTAAPATVPNVVLTHGLGYARNRYSKLDQVNTRSVKKLVPVWST